MRVLITGGAGFVGRRISDADLTRTRNLVGYEAKVQLAEIISRVVEDFRTR